MRSKRTGLYYLSLCTLSAVVLSACGNEPEQASSSDTAAARPAKLIQLSETSGVTFLNYPAIIESQALTVLSFEVGGVLTDVMVVSAQQVTKGDVLAKLDQTKLQADLKSATAQYKNAEDEYQRGLRLVKQNAISRSEVDKRKSTRDVNKSSLDLAKKALNDSVLVAPYSGAIAKVSVEIRQAIQAGESVITLLGEGGLEAKINIPASVISKAGRNKNNESNNSYFTLESDPKRQIPASFKEVVLEADSTSQTYEVTFAFEAPEDVIVLPGMNGTVWFQDPSTSSTTTGRLSLPLTAISSNGDENFVWVVDPETQEVSRRTIEIKKDVGENLEIVSGLKSGDTIVETGISALSEGMKVTRWVK